MFADDVLAARNAPTEIADRIRAAQRFVFARETVLSIKAISNSVLTSLDDLRRSYPLSRAPFPLCWFEWPYHDTYATVGFLVAVEGGNPLRGDCWLWSYGREIQRLSTPLLVSFDWTEAPRGLGPPASLAEMRELMAGEEEIGAWRRQGAQDELFRRYGVLDVAGRPVSATKWYSGAFLVELMRKHVLVLNIKNIIGTEVVTPTAALQKARARRGKLPLLEYTRVDIRLSKALAARAGEAADPRQPVRLHLCRGHFKIRKTGVFWWAAHPRGSASIGVIRRQVRQL